MENVRSFGVEDGSEKCVKMVIAMLDICMVWRGNNSSNFKIYAVCYLPLRGQIAKTFSTYGFRCNLPKPQ